jgi:hypothetical protein
VEQNRGSGHESIQLCSPYFQIKQMMEKKTASSSNVAGKTGILPAEN